MPVYSQNGWEAYNRSLITTAQIPGAGFGLAVRRGAAAVVLTYVAARFHAEVEPLVPKQCWGYAERPIIGSQAISNHASGTGVDFNAPRHWLGEVGTFTRQQVATIHQILRDCRGLVRWGGDYRGRKDEMHFELIGNQAQVGDLAAQLTQSGSHWPDITDPDNPQERFLHMLSDAEQIELLRRVRGLTDPAGIRDVVWSGPNDKYGSQPQWVAVADAAIRAGDASAKLDAVLAALTTDAEATARLEAALAGAVASTGAAASAEDIAAELIRQLLVVKEKS